MQNAFWTDGRTDPHTKNLGRIQKTMHTWLTLITLPCWFSHFISSGQIYDGLVNFSYLWFASVLTCLTLSLLLPSLVVSVSNLSASTSSLTELGNCWSTLSAVESPTTPAPMTPTRIRCGSAAFTVNGIFSSFEADRYVRRMTKEDVRVNRTDKFTLTARVDCIW